ncbi:MAG: TraR/DksA family transcriptional regulator [Bacteriovoracaceae bacterium]
MDVQTLEEFKTLFTDLYKDTLINMKKNGEEVFVEHLKGGDEIDQAQSTRDQQITLKLKGRENFFLKKIETALERIESGTFGECQDCGADISIERLKARPTASLCIHCKEEQERGEMHKLYQKRSHTLGKEIVNNNVVPLKFNHNQGDMKKRLTTPTLLPTAERAGPAI